MFVPGDVVVIGKGVDPWAVIKATDGYALITTHKLVKVEELSHYVPTEEERAKLEKMFGPGVSKLTQGIQ